MIDDGWAQAPVIGQPKPEIKLRVDPDHDPSMRLEDIDLRPGFYIVQGVSQAKSGDVKETTGRLVVVLGEDMLPPNIGRVLKTAKEGCTIPVGHYMHFYAPGGNVHDDKKPQPVRRRLDDDADLWVAHERNIMLSIPPAAR